MFAQQDNDRSMPFSLEKPTDTLHSARLAIKAQSKIIVADTSEIGAIEARGNYVVLILRSGPMPVREAMSTVAKKLKEFGFVRIHRSYIVNAAFVTEIKPLTTGEYLLRTRNGKTYTVSRTYKENLRHIWDLAIGIPKLRNEARV